MMRKDLTRIVSANPDVMHGHLVFPGTRIPLYVVVEEIADGTTLDEIVEGYPSLNKEQISRAMDFVVSLVREKRI